MAFLLNDSQCYRRFARLSFCWTPSASCLQDNISRIQAGTWQQVNRLLVKWANLQGLERGRQIRVDATAVESPIPYPTDSQLLCDSVLVLTRLLRRLARHNKIVLHDHRRRNRRGKREKGGSLFSPLKTDVFSVFKTVPFCSGSAVVHPGGTGTGADRAVFFAFDDHSIPLRSNLFLTLVPVEKHPLNPLLRRGPKGSPDEARAHFHGTVLRIDGKYRMWYVAEDRDNLENYGRSSWERLTDRNLASQLAYAESDDGIRWTKPSLGLIEYRGSRDNNLVGIEPGVLWPSVLYDREADPNKRFTMMFKGAGGPHRAGLLNLYPESGLQMSPLCAYSADGLNWHLAEHNPPLKQDLEGANFYTFNGHYFVQGQLLYSWAPQRGFLLNGDPAGRTLFTYRSTDLVRWSQAPAFSFARYGYRSAPLSRVEEAHTSNGNWDRGNVLVSTYLQWHGGPDLKSTTMDVGLLVSNDGLHFREPVPDFAWIPRGAPGTWEGGGTWGVSFLNVDNETRIYYGGTNSLEALATGGVGLATIKRDRFGYLSLKVPDKPGYLVTCALKLPDGSRMFANADHLGSGANLRFALLDASLRPIPGYSLEESRPLEASGFRQAVNFAQGPEILGVAGSRVYLQILVTGSLRGRNDRNEKVGNRGQIFSILRCIVVLFAEKSGKYGPILPLSQ